MRFLMENLILRWVGSVDDDDKNKQKKGGKKRFENEGLGMGTISKS